MTPAQITFFQTHGHVMLQGALSRKQVAPVKEQILTELSRRKIWAGGKALSSSVKDLPAFQQVNKLGQLIDGRGLNDRLITPDLRAAISLLADGRLPSLPDTQMQLLISLPHQGDWSLDRLSWHLDIAAPDPRYIPGVQAFVLIDDVKPHGGATLALAGSHRLACDEQRVRVRELLKRGGDLPGKLREHGLSILEMSGKAGDVHLMDMRLLHTPSINATRHIRMMATARHIVAGTPFGAER